MDFLNLCEQDVRSIEDLVKRDNLLNQRQCRDLSYKLFQTTRVIKELVSPYYEEVAVTLFGTALENLYRFLEKAKFLVNQCGEVDWCAAAVFQSQNENAFRDILHDVSLCYNVIYEEAKATRADWNELLHSSLDSMFLPATERDVLLDQQDLQKRLEDLANEPGRGALQEQCLARYLLLKLKYTSEQSGPTALDTCSPVLWQTEIEPSGTWGDYKLLGSGACSSGVCSSKWLGIPCAKKEFHDENHEKLVLKEAGILIHLKHPCIVNFFCCGNGMEEGDRFIAMELLEKSLAKLIKEKKVNFRMPVVVDIIVQIARGMGYLHDQGIAHRDLKPENVVVKTLTFPHLSDHYYCVKLVDFGVSKTKVEISRSHTISIRGVGTTMYRAPEVHPKAYPNGVKGKAVWFKADVFSFAMTCAHILTRRTPFGDMEQLNLLYDAQMKGHRPELPGDCPPELIALIKDCWRTDPRSRPDFAAICARLETLQRKIMTINNVSERELRQKDCNNLVKITEIQETISGFSWTILVEILEAGELKAANRADLPDPIVEVTLGAHKERTKSIKHTTNPFWINEMKRIPIVNWESPNFLTLRVISKSKTFMGRQRELGICRLISIKDYCDGSRHVMKLPLQNVSTGWIRFAITVDHLNSDHSSQGVAFDSIHRDANNRSMRYPILFYLAYSPGKDGRTKLFARALSESLMSSRRYKVYFDKSSLEMPRGQILSEQTMQALQETQVGVVVITEDFFRRQRCMTELVYLVDSVKKNRREVRILPLFYKLDPRRLREMLKDPTWDGVWAKWSSAENHALDVQRCRDAVQTLVSINGIEYTHKDESYDEEYRKTILEEIGIMCSVMGL